jgi:hypothetical protein
MTSTREPGSPAIVCSLQVPFADRAPTTRDPSAAANTTGGEQGGGDRDREREALHTRDDTPEVLSYSNLT